MTWYAAIFLLVLIGCLAWRVLCKIYNIPWPFWLAWWLENPYMIIFCHPKKLALLGKVEAGMTVAELGCGAGRVTPFIARRAFPGIVYAVDYQKGMLRLLKKRVSKEKLKNVSVHDLDLRSDSLPQNGFDRVIITTVLGEIPEYNTVLKKVFDSLQDGGLVSITEVIPDPCYIPSKTLRRQCETLGFRHLETFHNLVSYTMNLEKPCT